MNSALMRLAAAAGIEDGYWDGLGMRRDLQEATAVALLAGLDFDLSASDSAALCAALADGPFLSPLPPTVVVNCETTCRISIALSREQQFCDVDAAGFYSGRAAV